MNLKSNPQQCFYKDRIKLIFRATSLTLIQSKKGQDILVKYIFRTTYVTLKKHENSQIKFEP